nr:ribonuclease H-like domain-containing protein [Tanacetum cinerariifolium]
MHVSSLPNMDSLSNAIDADDLEEMDLKWQIGMLTVRARRFLQRARRNLGTNRPTSTGFDMSKVECYNCHKKGHFARECRSPKDTKRNGAAEPQRRNVPVETTTSNALVSQCDGVGSYDWSFQAEEEPTNYALMAFSSSSSSSNNEDYRKLQFDGISYQRSLESVEARLLVYQQNESVFEEDIKLLKLEVQLLDNALVSLRQTLEKAKQERDDLKLKLEKFQTSSKNLTELLASQTNAKIGNGYHAIPLPYTGPFMLPKPDLVFNNAPNDVETDHSTFTVKLSPTKPTNELSLTNQPLAPIIEDWVSDSEDESESKTPQNVPSFVQSTEQVKSPMPSVQHVETSIPAAAPKPASLKPTSNGKHRNRKACFVCKSLDHLIKDCDFHEKKKAQPTARNHAQWGTHKQFAQMTLLNPQQHVVPAAVLTQSKPVPFTTVRPVPTVMPKIKVTRPRHAKPIITKLNLPTRRHIHRSPSPKASNSPPRVTAIQASVVNAAQELNGGYVAFGGIPKGGKISRKGKIRTGKLDFDDVYFVKELKFNLFSVSQMCDKKNSILFADTECLVLSPKFKLPNESQVLLRVPKENY